jgi:hypothetical protein
MELRRHFENLFLITDQQTLFNIAEFGQLKLAVESIKSIEEELSNYQKARISIINEHPLLASYSNIMVIMYNSMMHLRKLTDESVYSWKVYLEIIEMIISKIVRDLH